MSDKKREVHVGGSVMEPDKKVVDRGLETVMKIVGAGAKTEIPSGSGATQRLYAEPDKAATVADQRSSYDLMGRLPNGWSCARTFDPCCDLH